MNLKIRVARWIGLWLSVLPGTGASADDDAYTFKSFRSLARIFDGKKNCGYQRLSDGTYTPYRLSCTGGNFDLKVPPLAGFPQETHVLAVLQNVCAFQKDSLDQTLWRGDDLWLSHGGSHPDLEVARVPVGENRISFSALASVERFRQAPERLPPCYVDLVGYVPDVPAETLATLSRAASGTGDLRILSEVTQEVQRWVRDLEPYANSALCERSQSCSQLIGEPWSRLSGIAESGERVEYRDFSSLFDPAQSGVICSGIRLPPGTVLGRRCDLYLHPGAWSGIRGVRRLLVDGRNFSTMVLDSFSSDHSVEVDFEAVLSQLGAPAQLRMTLLIETGENRSAAVPLTLETLSSDSLSDVALTPRIVTPGWWIGEEGFDVKNVESGGSRLKKLQDLIVSVPLKLPAGAAILPPFLWENAKVSARLELSDHNGAQTAHEIEPVWLSTPTFRGEIPGIENIRKKFSSGEPRSEFLFRLPMPHAPRSTDPWRVYKGRLAFVADFGELGIVERTFPLDEVELRF